MKRALRISQTGKALELMIFSDVESAGRCIQLSALVCIW